MSPISSESKALLCFVSCKNSIERYYPSIVSMMKQLGSADYVVAVGGHLEPFYDPRTKILQLDCNDSYEGLPEKVVKLCQFFNGNMEFSSYSHLCKLDDDMWVKSLPDNRLLKSDYAGRVKRFFCDRKYHWGKCSFGSDWNSREYRGEYTPFCLGGHGYVLSRKASLWVARARNLENEIYEDVFVAKVLNRHGIKPQKIRRLKKYFLSPASSFKLFFESYYANQSFNYYPNAW